MCGSPPAEARLLELIEERQPTPPRGVMQAPRDHTGEPQTICLHPDEQAGDDAEAVLF
jgi:hypothetical protein